jgi:hypothetical protein
MSHELYSFLANYNVQTKEPYTHISIGYPYGKWNVPDEMLPQFYELYSNMISVEPETGLLKLCNNNLQAHIAENKFSTHAPIIIDLDFKSSQKERKINNTIIDIIISTFMDIVKPIFDKSENFMCVILQRKFPYQIKNLWRDGLHIHFPYLICDYDTQFYIREMFIRNYPSDLGDNMEKIYDKMPIKACSWLLYGSNKRDHDPYDIVKIYNSDIKIGDLTKPEWVKLLSVRNKHRITSTSPLSFPITESVSINPKVKYDDDLIVNLLNMLSDKRVSNYSDWLNIGIILHHCSITSMNYTNYYDMWCIWSMKSRKFNEADNRQTWNRFYYKENGLTLATLHYYANKDNPKKYRNIGI